MPLHTRKSGRPKSPTARHLGLGMAALALAGGIPPTVMAQENLHAPATLQVTASSDAAVQHFWAGVDDWENIFFARAAGELQQALDADANFGLARVMHGIAAPGLTQSQRQAEIEKGLGQLSDATAPEMLYATALREWNSGASDAPAIAQTAAGLVPGDPHLAFLAAFIKTTTGDPYEGLLAIRDVTQRFPDFAPAYNILGYQLWNQGDESGAMTAIRRYVELAPDHPNPHDSYAELLQWSGRLDEAATHYKKAIALDPDYDAAYSGLAEVAQLQGNGKQALAYLEQALAKAPTPQGQINARRAVAAAYLINGDSKSALGNLTTAAKQAEDGGFGNLAALAHRQAAVVDAMSGGRSVDAELAAADQASSADDPGQFAWSAAAYAFAGKLDKAQTAAAALEKAAADAPGLKSTSHTINALILIQQNKPSEALAQLAQADPSNGMVQALTGLCYAKMGQKAEAGAFKTEVIGNRRLSFFDPLGAVAIVQAQKI